MGWTEYHATHYKNGKVDRKAECDGLWNENCKVLKSTMRGSTYYCALQTPEGDVIGYVVLTSGTNRRDPYFNFGYKAMSETCGPFCYDCPKGILDLLTETDSENANIWRSKCREKQMADKWLSKLKIGDKIVWRNERILTKHEPAYQFKTWFWYDEENGVYISKKHVTEMNSIPYKEV